MHAGASLESQGLLDADLHVRGLFQSLVVKYEATLPQRRHRFDALHLFRLLSGVRQYGQLVPTDISLGGELVEDDVLHEIGLHEEGYCHTVTCALIEVIEPAYHSGHCVLADVAVNEVQFCLNLAPQSASLVVVCRCRFERRVCITHEHLVLFEFRHTLEAYPLMPEYGAVIDGIVHHLLFPSTVSHEILDSLRLLLGPLLNPHRVAVTVDSLYLGHMHTL